MLSIILHIAVLALSVLALPPPHAVVDVADAREESRSEGISLEEFIHASTISSRSSAPIHHNATVQICTLPYLTGQCFTAIYPINVCIYLSGFAGHTRSFVPSLTSTCLLAQEHCDVNSPYVTIDGGGNSTLSPQKSGLDLSGLPWVDQVQSYICFEQMEGLRRFVVSRLRAGGKGV